MDNETITLDFKPVGVFITYAFQTSLLSIVMIFESDPVKKNKISV